ncbi:spondin domain-containing protein [Capnocytophaga catalasegens]|uniref:Uncharacterized protein n=1 Tax=Capnocytophaga catalasegens TaxID=1004260 RepID=A0AAV5AZ42_9FLAO|nr:spondin domain-containing protein [Capnocytophaga catalasegens]GIZ14534.1 hypothetical protein RCZ03_05350 [Capnocytophaga catalasegens]GJM50736.1 hypothetical protein RCZ15_17090 [Capnocytophaga catalasegens]GJM51889.1 hypothetical protein RCZ16_02070 [Capnocytophaga catalasegens]
MKNKNLFLSKVILSVISITALVASCNKEKTNSLQELDSNRTIIFENVTKVKKYVQSGVFKGIGSIENNGKKIENLILPGQSVSIDFFAGKGQKFMFATMFGASKDWFFASLQPGIKLFDDNGKPITGKVDASQVRLWDNGSKNDETGAAESNNITSITEMKKAGELMELMLKFDEKTSKFTLTITNTSKDKKDNSGKSLETPFSPGVWAVANVLGERLLDETPFFMVGKKSNPEISKLSEMGDTTPLYKKVQMETGIITGFSPAVVVVYQGITNPIYQLGKKEKGNGLKELSQMGMTDKLQKELAKIPGVKAVYVVGNSPIAPATKVSSNAIKIGQGDKIAFASMFGYSNDWFCANEDEISANFRGDLTDKTALLDSGTGIDQFTGAGNKQALFGGTPEAEDKNVEKVTQPMLKVSDFLKVTLQ